MEKGLKYVFGPVPSRRLCRSLGVNPIPFKTCNYSCVYCQLGKAINFTNTRREFFPPGEIAEEIIAICRRKEKKIDYVTFVGEGEPTLYSSLAKILDTVRKECKLPFALITNGALFYHKKVREDVLLFDVILSKIDAPSERVFKRINRPHRGIVFDRVIEGLLLLRKEFSGQLWIETMLVKGLNDDEVSLKGIKKILDRINPDRRFVSIPTRPPAENWVEITDPDVLFSAFKILNAEPIYTVEYREFDIEGFDSVEDAVLSIIRRHPIRMDEIKDILGKSGVSMDAREFLKRLVDSKKVKLREFMGNTYILPYSARI